MSWIDDEAHRMTQGESADTAVDPVQQIYDYLREQSLQHHAEGLHAQCAIEKERHYAAHHALEKARAWIDRHCKDDDVQKGPRIGATQNDREWIWTRFLRLGADNADAILESLGHEPVDGSYLKLCDMLESFSSRDIVKLKRRVEANL